MHPNTGSSPDSMPAHRGAAQLLGRLLAIGLVGVGLVAVGPATAQEADSGTDPTHSTAAVQAEEAVTTGHAEVGAPGAMVFVSPETGELVSVPAAGQMQRLLALGRSLAVRRAAQLSEGAGDRERRPALFATPVGVGARLDDRFLHALRLRIDENGEAQWACTTADHDHGDGRIPEPPRESNAVRDPVPE